jgi:L-lactate dehydrogenase complex protein LldF
MAQRSGHAQGSGDFGTRVTLALADGKLRGALDRASSLFGVRRQAALATLENADAVRDAARAGRLRAIAHLAEHLEQFEARLLANGAQVHWAETPDDANRIVAAIAAATRTKHAVKSKSMVSGRRISTARSSRPASKWSKRI